MRFLNNEWKMYRRQPLKNRLFAGALGLVCLYYASCVVGVCVRMSRFMLVMGLLLEIIRGSTVRVLHKRFYIIFDTV